MVAAAAISAAGSYMASKKKAEAANAGAGDAAASRQAAAQLIADVDMPSIKEQEVDYINQDMVYDYNPEQERAEQLDGTAYDDIAVDPRLRLAQMNALESLESRGRAGLTAEDMADINAIRRSSAGTAAAQDATILQNMEQRGMGGSGVELAARLAAGQRTAQTAAEQADSMAAMRQQARQEALVQAGTAASGLRNQDYTQEANLAQNKDALAQFNLGQRAGVQQRNVSSANTAAQNKASIRQDIEKSRAATANQQEQENKALIDKDYQNRIDQARSQADVYNKSASAAEKAAEANAQNKSDMIGGLTNIAATGVSSYFGSK